MFCIPHKVLFATRALGSVSLFLSIITAGVAIAEIMTAENKIAEALNQVLTVVLICSTFACSSCRLLQMSAIGGLALF